MKKLLIASCVLSIAMAGISYAATTATSAAKSTATNTGTTYTEQFIQKHTQGIVNKEKALRAKNAQQKAKAEAAKQENAKKRAAQKAKIKAKKDALDVLLSK